VRTDLGLIDEQIRLYAAGREETIIGMKQLHEIAYEMRDALEAGAFAVLGALLREAYESKKRMNPRVTDGTPIERLLDAALAAGAVGGKICGAGGGGHVLVACEPARRESVTSALEAYGGRVAEFSFRADGVRARTDAGTWRPM
jgi:D-glycero-alpha-D-manno-heptose-7-phosphate kinase